MLKIYLVSVLPVQPLPFSFSPIFFLFQCFFLFSFCVSLFSFSTSVSFSFFPAKTCCPIQPQCVQLFSPKCFQLFSPKRVQLFSPKRFQLFSLKRFQLFMPTSKAQKKSSFSSVHPRPNIFSSCFMSLLFK